MPELPLTGTCQCGGVRYEISQPPLMIYNCHCTNCQKISGSAFGVSMAVSESGFAITHGTPTRFEWTSDVGSVRYGLFCASCGNRIAHGQAPTRGVLSVRAGTLVDTSWVRPAGDIWTSSAQPWMCLPEERLQYPRQPADYAPLMEAFAELGLFSQ